MVFSEKMLENTGMPSTGQLVPVNGLHSGEEYGRKPTNVTPFPLLFAPTFPPPGRNTVGPPLGPPYGNVRPPTGILSLAETKYELSADCGPQATLGSLFKVEIACRSLHVCGFPWFRS